MEELLNCKSPDIRELAQSTIQNLLPDKSREKYEKEYLKFNKWRDDNQIESISENVLVIYFELESKMKKSSTLWSMYSMLRSCLNIYKNVDISTYVRLQALLKKKSVGYKPKKSKILSLDNITKFLQEANDDRYLAAKVILIMGYCGACRREELTNICIEHVQIKCDVVIVSVPQTKTYISREFFVTEILWIKLIQKYVSLRPVSAPSNRFFLIFRNGRCINSPIGINSIGKIPFAIATFLKLADPNFYTGHCFRRSSVTELAEKGGDLITVKRYRRSKSSAVAEEIKEKFGMASFDMLPKKSREKYEKRYNLFLEWCTNHNITKYSENALMGYFADMAEKYSPPTMWAYYSMLKATLNVKHNVDIGNYIKLSSFLKQKSEGYTPKESKLLLREEIIKFLLNAPDKIYLMIKVCTIFGIAGACRPDELIKLSIDGIEDQESILIVHISTSKTNKPHRFIVTADFEGGIKPIELYRKYRALRPPHVENKRFFLAYRHGKCTIQPVGIHSIDSIPSKIASYLNLPNVPLYTGHGFRKISTKLFPNASGPKSQCHSGCKCDCYIEKPIVSGAQQEQTQISSFVVDEDMYISENYDMESREENEYTSENQDILDKVEHETTDTLIKIESEENIPETTENPEICIEKIKEEPIDEKFHEISDMNIDISSPIIKQEPPFIDDNVDSDLESSSEPILNDENLEIDYQSNYSENDQSTFGIQTKIHVQCINEFTQTDSLPLDLFEEITKTFLDKYDGELPTVLPDCVEVMYKVDDLINKLTNFRQSLFTQLKYTSEVKKVKRKRQPDEINEKEVQIVEFNKKPKKKKTKHKNNKLINSHIPNVDQSMSNNTEKSVNLSNSLMNEVSIVKEAQQSEKNVVNASDYKLLEFKDITEKILVIKVMENYLIISTESGKILYCSLEDGRYIHTLEVTNVPVTCLSFAKNNEIHKMYVGSFDNVLKIYNFNTQELIATENIDDSLQCIESCWDYIFMGGIRGSLIRYSLKKGKIEYSDKISETNVLVLKAAQEGARRILLVGSRNTPVCIRDAMSGLHMRTLAHHISPTVYSLLLERSLVYCGTTMHNILVFSFHDGTLLHTHKAPDSKGIGCMKIFENLLFASCHNGLIYIYNINNNKFVDSIKGPGGVILSMEVIKYQIIVSTMSFKFKSIPIPNSILQNIT